MNSEQGGVISYHFLLVILVFIMFLSLLSGGWGPRWGWANGIYGTWGGLVICLLLCIFKLIGWI